MLLKALYRNSVSSRMQVNKHEANGSGVKNGNVCAYNLSNYRKGQHYYSTALFFLYFTKCNVFFFYLFFSSSGGVLPENRLGRLETNRDQPTGMALTNAWLDKWYRIFQRSLPTERKGNPQFLTEIPGPFVLVRRPWSEVVQSLKSPFSPYMYIGVEPRRSLLARLAGRDRTRSEAGKMTRDQRKTRRASAFGYLVLISFRERMESQVMRSNGWRYPKLLHMHPRVTSV